MKYILRVILLHIIFTLPCFSYVEQGSTEKIIKENRNFIDFLDVSLTNFGDDASVTEFKKIYEMHFNGFVAFLQSDYRRAFKRLYESQGKQEKLCSDLVKNRYLEDSKYILDKLAPLIVRSKNTKSRLYLTLGYRDRTVGRNNYVSGMASNPRLHSYRLSKFIKAIKRIRRAKRYGFLALFESQDQETKKEIYNYLLKSENEQGNPFYTRFSGKIQEDFLDEMNLSYNDYRENQEKGETTAPSKQPVKEKAPTDAGVTVVKKEDKPEKTYYETSIQKRVRFKNEGRLAKLLLYSQFDRATDYIKKYVDDINYKLILATFEVLIEKRKGAETGIDYNNFKIHHRDNYLRLYKPSALKSFMNTLKVEDDIEDDFQDKPADDGQTLKENKVQKGKKTPSKEKTVKKELKKEVKKEDK